jgi:hypothetical protein
MLSACLFRWIFGRPIYNVSISGTGPRFVWEKKAISWEGGLPLKLLSIILHQTYLRKWCQIANEERLLCWCFQYCSKRVYSIIIFIHLVQTLWRCDVQGPMFMNHCLNLAGTRVGDLGG